MISPGAIIARSCAHAVDRVDDAALTVDRENRRGLTLVDSQAVCDRLFGVIGTTLLGRTQRKARDALFARDCKLDHCVERRALLGKDVIEVGDLRSVARVAIEEEPVRRVFLSNTVTHKCAGQLVGNEVASLDNCLDLLAKLGALRDVGAEDVAGRDGRDAERIRNAGALGALAGALRANDEEACGCGHRRSPS